MSHHLVRRLITVVTLLAATAVPALSATQASASTRTAAVSTSDTHTVVRAGCGATPAAGYAACNAYVRTSKVHPNSGTSTTSGYIPSQIQAAYGLAAASAADGSSQTIGIVDAYNDPTAAADLAVYRSAYGLSACTVASGCLKITSQTGSTTSLPSNDGGWAEEESLDLDMASATCPLCKIILVEASSASYANLGTAVNEAVALGANVVSNSYGGSESSGETSYDTYYHHSGVIITASTGDSGYGVEYPAASQYVVAVGGTSLSTSTTASRGWTETAWADAGSGCSKYETKLTGQSLVTTGCSKRAVADVSAVADPNTGVAVYDSTSYDGYVGWLQFGGTSVSSPLIAGVFALAGNESSVSNNTLYNYVGTAYLNDVTSGSNGSCSVSELCTATTGWDGPTGLGTPEGITAF
ncbi:peptidase S8 [Actinospica sp. MGRD01-02]|uniref:Peptidase S8 n=1 Tax=Actinospica acidithermotolerans TaxID=2828514 RepID=A0A941EC37_9ACTN|nr:peptidase S8 [Actinospica acidithermotolerans]MBR7827873.1 peptidase S8 [Actinospica acidithermotolerans]